MREGPTHELVLDLLQRAADESLERVADLEHDGLLGAVRRLRHRGGCARTEPFTQQVDGDAAVLTEQADALHHVLQFTHVPGPGVALEGGRRRRFELDLAAEEVAGERHDVGRPLAERRQLHRHDVEAVQQIGAESTGIDLGPQVPIGRRDDPHVDVHRLVAADALELALLQHAQELGLHRGRHLTDLVEEERATVRELEAPDASRARASERAGLVAEQLALEQALRKRGAVQFDERAIRPIAGLVNERRHALLARAALASDQHRRHARRDALHQLDDGLHLRRGDEHVTADALGAQEAVLAQESATFGNPLQGQLQVVDDERLLEDVGSTGPHRVDRDMHRAVRRDEDHRPVGITGLARGEDGHAVLTGHLEVRDDEVVGALPEGRDRGIAVLDRVHVATEREQRLLEELARQRFVVGEQHILTSGHAASSSGSRTRNCAPGSPGLSRRRSPPRNASTREDNDRPSPEPRAFVDTIGSRTRAPSSVAIPGPLSRTVISIERPRTATSISIRRWSGSPPPFGDSAFASAALRSRLASTRTSASAFAVASTAPARATWSSCTPACAAASPTIVSIDAMRGWVRSGRAKPRSDLTMRSTCLTPSDTLAA